MPRMFLNKFVMTTQKLTSQRGDMLIESMIGLLLLAIAGMGVVELTAKSTVAQREGKVQDQVINELRSMIINRANVGTLCDGLPINTDYDNRTVDVEQCALTTASVNGVAITDVHAPIILSTTISTEEGASDTVRVGATSAGVL